MKRRRRKGEPGRCLPAGEKVAPCQPTKAYRESIYGNVLDERDYDGASPTSDERLKECGRCGELFARDVFDGHPCEADQVPSSPKGSCTFAVLVGEDPIFGP